MRRFDVLIVGAGHGGAQAATALRQRNFSGTIAIIGDEADLPYDRPALSKDYLAGEKSVGRLLIRPAAFWAEREIAIYLGRRVVAIDPTQKNVATDRGDTFAYGHLIWATGGNPRRLTCAGHDLAGVHAVRCRADVDQMRDELDSTQQVAVVGGGYIGLEAAAVLAKMGKKVTVIEAQDRVLARVAGEPLSRFFEAEHRARGIDLRLGGQVELIEEVDGRAAGVRLRSGETIAAQMVIVGIGIVPAAEPLLAAGAKGGNGVAVDRHGRSSLPDVFVIGDCALHANIYAAGEPVRVESVQNATDMATTVARALTGDPQDYAAVPWFWSNQYDLRLQTVGLSMGHDAHVIRGDISSRSFSVIYLRHGAVSALDCVNATRDYVQGKALVVGRVKADPVLLADPSIALKDLVPAPACAAA